MNIKLHRAASLVGLRAACRPAVICLTALVASPLSTSTSSAAPGTAAGNGPRPAATLITDVHVVPMDRDTILEGHAVLVRDGRIVAVAPGDEIEVPDGAREVSGQGGYLIPGLADLHVHVTDPADFPLYLAAGVTRVRDAGGHDLHLIWRGDIESGRLRGPTLHACGPPMFDIETAEAAEKAVSDLATEGWDCIKVYDRIEADAWSSLVKAARRHGMLATGHIPRNLTWQDMLAAGPDSVDHAEEFLYSPLSGEDLPVIAREMKEKGTALISSLITYDLIGRQVLQLDTLLERREMSFTSPIERRMRVPKYNSYLARFPVERIPRLRQLLQTQKAILKNLHTDGVRILAGTDAGPGMAVPGTSLHDELRHLVDAGLKPFEALQSATVHAAEYLGVADAGTVTPGQVADLVIVMGNPLADISNTSLILGVMTRGRYETREALLARVRALRPTFQPEEELIALYEAGGMDALMNQLEVFLQTGTPMPVRERMLNEFAYQIRIIEERPADALRLFELVTRAWPDSRGAWDSLAECLEITGDAAAARRARKRAEELRPAASS